MALVEYSILTIGAIPIPLSTDLTATISSGLNSRKVFTYQDISIPYSPAQQVKKPDGTIIDIPEVKASNDIAIRGEDNITLTLTQSNNSKANKLFTIINSVLAVATGINRAVDLYTDSKDIKNALNSAGDLLLKQLTICSYFDLGGDGSFFNYRLIDCSFDKQLDEGITTISMTFSNYYNDPLTKDEFDKTNNITRI